MQGKAVREKLLFMMNARHLRRLFQGILAAAITPGCGGGIDPSDFTSNLCPAREKNALEGVTPASPVDYMELRAGVPFADPPMFTTLAKQGEVCAKAAASTCQDTFSMTNPTEGWSTGAGFDVPQNFEYIIWTRADEVGTVTTLPELKAFLAPIDNQYEAGFLAIATLPAHSILCSGNNGRAASGGFDLLTTSGFACGEGSHRDEHIVHVSQSGDVTIAETVVVEEGEPGCAIGRKPEGLAPAVAPPAADRIGALFADAARLEAASVIAFERFERELRAFGAPRGLVRDARRARNDEVRHARMTRRLAKRNGAQPLPARVRRVPDRSLFDFVKENAVEGCILETFGALVATYQSSRATDVSIARAMSVIAEDETRHASLAWRVAKWAESKLGADERAEVAALQRAAVRRLARRIAAKDAPEPRAGLPGRDESLRLLRGLSRALGVE